MGSLKSIGRGIKGAAKSVAAASGAKKTVKAPAATTPVAKTLAAKTPAPQAVASAAPKNSYAAQKAGSSFAAQREAVRPPPMPSRAKASAPRRPPMPAATPENDSPGAKVLGVHSNSSQGLGHSWVSVTDTKTGNVATYGMWPDDHPAAGDNGNGSDLRKDLELAVGRDGKLDPTGEANRYYTLTAGQEAKLTGNLSRHHEYRGERGELPIINERGLPTNNCASYATDTVAEVVGEDVDADGWLGFEMPSELSKSVGELEKEKPTVAPKWSVKRFLEPFDKSGKRQTRGPSIG